MRIKPLGMTILYDNMDLTSSILTVAVGSPPDKVCSVGAFARAEAKALSGTFKSVQLSEPDKNGNYPVIYDSSSDFVFYHTPSLDDRKRPWNFFKNALLIRMKLRKAKFISIVHEFSEAPTHWKLRQVMLYKLSDGLIVNTKRDYDSVKKYSKNILRTTLGPTLYDQELLNEPTEQKISGKIRKTRDELSSSYGLNAVNKWVLYPGLITPGKGVDSLVKFSEILKSEGAQLILMGAFGPKEKDRTYAESVIDELKKTVGSDVLLLNSLNDDDFKKFLLTADLIVLPFDAGVSERRSSFLAAMSCGANVWTTAGEMSEPLRLSESGAFYSSVNDWRQDISKVLNVLTQALKESEESKLLRRVKNLKWALTRQWDTRVKDISHFLNTLS